MGTNNYPPSAEEMIRKLDQRVKDLEAAAQTRVPLNTITGGTLQVQDAAGNTYVYIGRLAANWPDGSPQYGIRILRQNGPESVGNVSLEMFTDDPANAAQTMNMFDASGHLVFGDDAISTFGLAKPYLSMPLMSSDSSSWPSTTSSTMQDMFFGFPPVQHPKVVVWGLISAPNGTNAQVQLVSGTNVLAGPMELDGVVNGIYQWQLGPVPFASVVGAGVGDLVDLRVQACRIAGTGTVQIAVGACVGVQS